MARTKTNTRDDTKKFKMTKWIEENINVLACVNEFVTFILCF